jgi:hypothetical protein
MEKLSDAEFRLRRETNYSFISLFSGKHELLFIHNRTLQIVRLYVRSYLMYIHLLMYA